FYELDKRHYDVVVLGDVSAARFALGDPDAVAKLARLVKDKNTGLLLLGGYDTFAAGGWDKTPLASLLPVKMDKQGQMEVAARVRPTAEGIRDYPFLNLRSEPARNQELWERQFDPLDGMTYLGKPASGATV